MNGNDISRVICIYGPTILIHNLVLEPHTLISILILWLEYKPSIPVNIREVVTIDCVATVITRSVIMEIIIWGGCVVEYSCVSLPSF